jgi:predicted DNA-binding transcriptional regulator AlpA
MQTEFDRRVYRREFLTLVGCGTTWFRQLMERGTIPRGHRDPGGKRDWWRASEVRATLDAMQSAAERSTTAPKPTVSDQPGAA